MSKQETNYDRFTKTYNYTSLLKKYSLEDEGMWQIFGEDPNCDFGGCHSQPNLGFAEGKLADVIEYAVDLPGFWQWGAGGDIKKMSEIKKVDNKTVERRRFLLEKRAEYQEMVDIYTAELEKL